MNRRLTDYCFHKMNYATSNPRECIWKVFVFCFVTFRFIIQHISMNRFIFLLFIRLFIYINMICFVKCPYVIFFIFIFFFVDNYESILWSQFVFLDFSKESYTCSISLWIFLKMYRFSINYYIQQQITILVKTNCYMYMCTSIIQDSVLGNIT